MNESRLGCKWRVLHIRLYCSTSVSTYRTATRTACSPICQASSFSIRHPWCHKQRTSFCSRCALLLLFLLLLLVPLSPPPHQNHFHRKKSSSESFRRQKISPLHPPPPPKKKGKSGDKWSFTSWDNYMQPFSGSATSFDRIHLAVVKHSKCGFICHVSSERMLKQKNWVAPSSCR
jgi:hypothetical protein